PLVWFICVVGAAFNAWISLFNLIPFGIFDGFKIFLWNKLVWAAAFSASVVLTVASTYLIS
ncbi:MAG: metalloprotease, partial [Candidatus Bathyarchaeia archaeon]